MGIKVAKGLAVMCFLFSLLLFMGAGFGVATDGASRLIFLPAAAMFFLSLLILIVAKIIYPKETPNPGLSSPPEIIFIRFVFSITAIVSGIILLNDVISFVASFKMALGFRDQLLSKGVLDFVGLVLNYLILFSMSIYFIFALGKARPLSRKLLSIFFIGTLVVSLVPIKIYGFAGLFQVIPKLYLWPVVIYSLYFLLSSKRGISYFSKSPTNSSSIPDNL